MSAVPPPAAPPGRGRGRLSSSSTPSFNPDAVVIQTGRGAGSALPAGGGGRTDSALSNSSTASSIAPPSPEYSRAPSVAGSSAGDDAKKAAEKVARALEKELRLEPLPQGWKVYGILPAPSQCGHWSPEEYCIAASIALYLT
jgi:hypothetical protein